MLGLALPLGHARAGDFASAVIEYRPAPGQFINDPQFNNPAMALGAPIGGGTSQPSNAKVVSLGGFGGSITLAFDQTVLDDPCNPFGLDAIVFGNSFFNLSNPEQRWGEVGMIEICLDANGNGMPDDGWHAIAGPALVQGIPADQFETQLWDNDPQTPAPPDAIAWYPDPLIYPDLGTSYMSGTFRAPPALETVIVQNSMGEGSEQESWWALTDLSPVLLLGDTDADDVVDDPSIDAGAFYTEPDNPRRLGITPGSGGGDAFDIAWALDPATGEPSHLPGFDFVRVSTSTNVVLGVLGESSTEVSGVSDVRPRASFFDRTGDDVVDVEDLYAWHALAGAGQDAADLDGDQLISDTDRRFMAGCVRRAELGDVTSR